MFDLRSSPSIGGTYTGMGLFWSMRSRPGYIDRFQMNNASIPLHYQISVHEGHSEVDGIPLSSTSIERKYLADGVTRRVIKEPPLHGTLFVPPGEGPFPAVITVYGGRVEEAACG